MPKQHTILVIDDEPEVVKSVKHLLRLDYNVLSITSAREAMDILNRQEVDVVMTDQRMPEMSGVQLLSSIRGLHPDATRLLFTGYADIRAVIDAINQGNVYRYITKPWDPDDLHTIIREACAHHDLIVERKQLIDELQKKNAELKLSNELKEAFIRVAGHEFRTPVTLLIGFSALALRLPDLTDALRDHLGRIDGAAVRLERLTTQVLTMLSTEKFDILCDRRPEDMASVLASAVEDTRPFVERRRQLLLTEIGDDLGSLSIDAEKVRGSLNELLLNAIKFTPDGGRIMLKAHRDDRGIVIEVTDTGSGIAEESLPRMFEPFFTGFDVSRHSSGQYEHGTRGLGLGLSIVKAFIELHGGQVAVHSQPGRGSAFTIFLPDEVRATPPANEDTPLVMQH